MKSKKQRFQRMYLSDLVSAPYVIKIPGTEEYRQLFFRKHLIDDLSDSVGFDLVYFSHPSDELNRVYTHVGECDEIFLSSSSFQNFVFDLSNQAKKCVIL